MKAVVLLAVILIMAMTIIAERGQGAAIITCNQVDTSLAPCLIYLTGGAQPSVACCTGIQNLKDITMTTEDRQAACICIKEAASRFSIKPDKASMLPQECGIGTIGVPITPDIDCRKIAWNRRRIKN